MKINKLSLHGYEFTDEQLNLIIYNNEMIAKRLLSINMGSNINSCVATINALQTNIFN